MAEYVSSQQEFERIKRVCHSLVRTDETLPANVFRTSYGYYRFADFDGLFISGGKVWGSLLAFARKFDAASLSLLVLDPAPESYHSWSGKYGAIMIDPKDQADHVVETLCTSPEDAVSLAANALIVIGDRFAVFSESSPNWCLWADRHHRVAILGLGDYPTWKEIEETWTETWWDVEDAIDQLFGPGFFPRHVPEGFCLALVANYGGIEFCPRAKLW